MGGAVRAPGQIRACAYDAEWPRRPNAEDTGRSIASYVRSLMSGGSSYDRLLLGDASALDPAVKRGLKLFQDMANRSTCHAGSNLTDERFHNTGVAWRSLDQHELSLKLGGCRDNPRAVSGRLTRVGANKKADSEADKGPGVL